MLCALAVTVAVPRSANALSPVSQNLVENASIIGSSEEGIDGHPASAVGDGYYRTNWTTTAEDSLREITIRLPGAPSDAAQKVVRSYFVRSGLNDRDRIPSSWVLEASNDGSSWTVLDRRSGSLRGNKQTVRVGISNRRAYNSYRLRFGASKSGPIEVADIALCEKTCDTSIHSVSENLYWPITAHGQFVTSSDAGVSTELVDGQKGTAWTARPGRSVVATATIATPHGQALPLSHYVIAAGDDATYFPKSWKIEGSNDGVNWSLVDEQSGVRFRKPGEVATFATDFIDRNYRLYRMTAGEQAQYAEIALCPWSCGRTISSRSNELINPVRSDFAVTVGGARTNLAALTKESGAGALNVAAFDTATVEYRSKNGQAQAVGAYSIQANSRSRISWTVWGKRSSSDGWNLMDTQTGFLADGTLTTFGLAPRFPVSELKVEFETVRSPATIDRFSLCSGPDCQIELTGAPSDPSTTVWQAQASNDLGGATLVGNGPLGAMVYGGVAQERIGINEHQIWQGSPLARGTTTTPRVRKQFTDAVYADDRATVDALLRDHFLDRTPVAHYQTAGSLVIDTHSGTTGYQYRRSLDTATGVATVSYVGDDGARHTRRTFASFTDPVIVSNLSVDGGTQDLTVGYDSPMPNVTVTANARTAVSAELIVDGNADGFSSETGAVQYRVHILVRANDGAIKVVNNQIEIANSSSVDFIIAADTNVTNYRSLRSDPAALTRSALGDNVVNRRGFEDLLRRHLETYRPLFDRVSFTFPESATTHMPTDRRAKAGPGDAGYYALEAQYARYLLMASSRNSEPSTLQGRWNPNRWPAWWSDYHLDINLQLNYSIAENLNVAETTGPLFDFIDELSVEGTRIAKSQYGVTNGGWVAHITADLWRQSPVVRGSHTQWVQGGNWIAQSLWNHYAYSGDRSFLARRAYPVLKGNALFFDSILVTNPDRGDDHLVHFWSTSPENQPKKADRTPLSQVQMMPTMDAQLIRETYEHVIEASTTLGVDAELRAQWERTLAKLPPPDPIGSWGQIQEYYRDIDIKGDTHRHASHLYGAADGYTLDLENPAVAQAVRTSLVRRPGGTAWAAAWKGMIGARLSDSNIALEGIQGIARSSFPNLLANATNQPQIDGTFGTADVFTEMLVQSHRGSVDLLAALPTEWTTGKVRGLRAQGGFTITDLQWRNGALTRVRIRSEAGNPLVVRYGSKRVELNTRPGQVITLDGSLTQR